MTATISIRPDGAVELRDWPGWAMQVLDEMALLAGPEFPDERVRRRFFQAPGSDPGAAEEWRRSQHPELFTLFASSQEVVVRDLGAAERDSDGEVARLVIPREHVPAWIAAINAARLHLGTMHDIDAAAMQAAIDDVAEDLRPVVARIDMLGEIQFHLIRSIEPLEPESLGVFPPAGEGEPKPQAKAGARAKAPAKAGGAKPQAKRGRAKAKAATASAGGEQPTAKPRKRANPKTQSPGTAATSREEPAAAEPKPQAKAGTTSGEAQATAKPQAKPRARARATSGEPKPKAKAKARKAAGGAKPQAKRASGAPKSGRTPAKRGAKSRSAPGSASGPAAPSGDLAPPKRRSKRAGPEGRGGAAADSASDRE